MATGLQDVHLITSLRVFQGGPSIWQECSGLSKLVLEIGEIIGDIGKGCVHFWIRRQYQQWPTSEDCLRLHPQATKSDWAFDISLWDDTPLVSVYKFVKKIGYEKGDDIKSSSGVSLASSLLESLLFCWCFSWIWFDQHKSCGSSKFPF